MRLSRPLVLVSSLALALTIGVVAQSGAPGQGGAGGGASGQGGAGGQGGGGQGGAASNVPPGIMAGLVNLQMELNALNSMNDAASQQFENAGKRIELMNSFLTTKKLNGDYQTFRQGWKPIAAPLSFQQAYTTALQAEELHGGVMPSTNNLDTLTNEVAATTTMIQQRWSALNGRRNEVGALTQFLNDKKLMDEYHDFATQKAAAFQAAEDAKAAQQPQLEKEREAKAKARKDAALTYLQKQWDAQSHKGSSGFSYAGSYSQSASQPGPFSQTPSTAYTAGTGDTPPVYPVNPYPGGAVSDYWTGSYYNGYSDPYYDVNGFPGGSAYGGGRTAAGAYQRMADSSSPFRGR